MLSSGVYKDEDFSSLSLPARLLFIGMVTNADDDGRLSANPKILKSDIFPLDDEITSITVESLINEIAKSLKSVCFYEVDGKRYAAFLKWTDHQTIRADRKRDSTIPAPTITAASTQPNVNQVTTNPQPNVGIKEWNGSEGNIREVNNAPSDDGELLENLQDTSGINYEFQVVGLDIFTKTKAPPEKRGECMRIAKVEKPGHIMSALSFVQDYSGNAPRFKMFCWKLNEIKKAAKLKAEKAEGA